MLRAGAIPLEPLADERDTRIHALVVELLGLLLRAPAEETDAGIDRALAALGTFCDVDRTYAFRLRTEDGVELIDNTHEWVSPGTTPAIELSQGMPAELLVAWRDRFDADQAVEIPEVAALPDSDPLKDHLTMQGIVSLLAVPMREEGRLTGFVGFDAVRGRREFPPGEVLLLKSVADAIGTVLSRRAAAARIVGSQAELAEAHNRLKATLEALPDLVLEVDADGRYVAVHTADTGQMMVPPERLIGRTHEEAMPPEIAALNRRAMAEVDATGRSGPHPFTADTPRGPRRYTLTVAPRAPHLPAGRPGYVFVARDVTPEWQLQREAERLSLIARRMTDLVMVIGLDDRIEWVNPAFEARTGWRLEEVVGRTPKEVLHAPGTDSVEVARIAAAMDAGRAVRAELLNRARDGEEFWTDIDIHPLHDADGRPTGFVSIETDITERKRQAAELARLAREATEARDRLEMAVEALPDAFAFYDAEDRLVLCNHRYREFYPRTAPLMQPGVRFADLVRAVVANGELPDAVGREEAWLAGRLERHRQANSTEERRIEGGRWLRVIERATPDGGRVGMRIDITEQKQAEQRLADIIHGAEAGTWEWTVTSGENIINARWAEIVGYTLDELRPLTIDVWRSLLHPDDHAAAEARLARVFACAEDNFEYELRMRHKAGHWVWVMSRGRVTRRAPDGQPEAMAGVHMDITALKRAEERLADIIEGAEAGTWEWDLGSGVIAINAQWAGMIGRRRDELASMTVTEYLAMIHPEDFRHSDTLMRRVLAGELDEYRAELRLRHRDGDWIWVQSRGRVARRDAGGAPELVAGVQIDITALKRAEERLAQIIDAAAAGTWEYDYRHGQKHINERWAEIVGYTRAEMERRPGFGFRDLVHPEDMAVLDRLGSEQLAGGQNSFANEIRMRHRDGHWVWVLSRGQVMDRDETGAPVRAAGIHLDITERKRLETQLVVERDYLARLMETSASGITGLDAEGRIIYANREAERILGLSAAEMDGLAYNAPDWEITALDGGAFPQAELPFVRAMAERVTVRDVRFAIVRQDGTRRVLSVNAAPLEAEGLAVRVVCSIADITEQVAAETELRDAAERAEAANRAKSQFLANMSHEIRTPLNGVLGMADLLHAELDDPRRREMVAVIRSSGEGLLTLLNDILDMSKIEAGKMTLEAVGFAPAELVARTLALHAPVARDKGLVLEAHCHPDEPARREGDPHRLQQILHNLLSNAIRFTEAGSVRLRLEAAPGAPLTLEVADTGIGMSEAQVARLFDPFAQAESSTSRRYGGTGLGSSIVKKLVELMGGEIAVESRVGVGTTVRVTLPLPECADQSSPDATAPVPALEERPLAGLRLLVADDNATNRKLLELFLTRAGAEPTVVTDGRAAVETWSPARFDLLLLDIAMPGMDGVEALAAIRTRAAMSGTPPPRAVAITANAMTHQVESYLAAGFDAHVAKPFRRETLIAALLQLAGR